MCVYPWRRKWQPLPVFLPGKSHGQRSLVGYSPWGCTRVGHDLAAKQCVCVYTYLIYTLYLNIHMNHFAVHLKLTQYCKLTIQFLN